MPFNSHLSIVSHCTPYVICSSYQHCSVLLNGTIVIHHHLPSPYASPYTHDRYIEKILSQYRSNVLLWLIHSCDLVTCPSLRALCVHHLSQHYNRYYDVLHHMAPTLIFQALRQSRPDSYGNMYRTIMRDCVTNYLRMTTWDISLEQLTDLIDDQPLKGYTSVSLIVAIYARVRSLPLHTLYYTCDRT